MSSPTHRNNRLALAVTIAAVSLALAVPSPALANTGTIRIASVHYDAVAGPDPLTNTYLNKEYITIRNAGTSSRTLTGWTVRDLYRTACSCQHVYKFGTYTLRPGYSVRIHTGRGTNSSTDRFWGLTYYVWGDDADSAYLRNTSNTTVWSCSWTAANTSPRYC